SYVDGPKAGNTRARVRAFDADDNTVSGGFQPYPISESYPGTYTKTWRVPDDGVSIERGVYTASDVHANTMVRIENLDVKREGGEIEGAYSFPFFPIFLADSTVQGDHELVVEGDAPVWPVWEITGPGKDVEIIGPGGDRIFIEGE